MLFFLLRMRMIDLKLVGVLSGPSTTRISAHQGTYTIAMVIVMILCTIYQIVLRSYVIQCLNLIFTGVNGRRLVLW